MKRIYDRLNESLRGKTLVDVLVQYRNWTFHHEWWFPNAFIILIITTILCFLLPSVWPQIAGVGVGMFLLMWGVPVFVEDIMDENDQISPTATELLTWSNLLAVNVLFMLVYLIWALTSKPPRLAAAVFFVIWTLIVVFLFILERRMNKKRTETEDTEERL